MSFTIKKVYYFDAPCKKNTDDCIRFARERVKELGIQKVVVASTSDKTARKVLQGLEGTGLSLIVVTHVVGFSEPVIWEFDTDTKEALERAGARIITGTHLLSGFERSPSRSPRMGGGSRTEAIAEALRRIVAVGLKVAVECVLIATDQEILSPMEEVIAIGGTMSGADTVCVIRPSHTASFFDLQMREIVAMPRNR